LNVDFGNRTGADDRNAYHIFLPVPGSAQCNLLLYLYFKNFCLFLSLFRMGCQDERIREIPIDKNHDPRYAQPRPRMEERLPFSLDF